MSYDYSENILVQEAAGNLLCDELGWDVVYAYNKEVLGENGTLGRTNYKEILLKRDLRAALQKFNPWITPAQISEAIGTLEQRLSTASLLQVNEEKYFLLRDGVPVTVRRPDGRTEQRRAMVIDFQNVAENRFLAVKEMKIHGDLYRRRTDIVGFVNGLPLLFVELKNTTVDVQNAYTDNYTDYLDTIPHLFYYNAFLILSNGVEAKVGTLGSKYEFFHEWKRLNEQEAGSVALETMLRGICKKENFLDLFENFIFFDHSGGSTAKILARNHQYLGVNEAVKAYAARKLNNGKLGVFWHTQGSGKSYSMLFLSQKIRRKFAGSPTIVILTDRDELNRQISDTFENCGLLGKGTKASQYIASSGADLEAKLRGNPSFIFTLIHKFNRPDAEPIYPDHDIILMSDEAHRTQNGVFAENMMRMLPTASRIGFTGTPLLSNDNITARTFGGYISIYDFKRAVDAGATVPLYYENRGEKILDLHNPEITDRILDAIEAADLDVDKQDKLEAEFAKEIHLLTAEPRLKSIARDFAGHYSDLWTSGKAMFVCLNKVTCVRMYNFVQQYWQAEIEALEIRQKHASQQEAQELERKIQWMKETEMAVVISQDQNEIQTFKKWGLDILPHRAKMEKRELDKEHLLERIRLITEKARNFLEEQGFDLQTLIDATDFQKTALLLDACDAVCESIETKKTFTTMASELVRLYKYTDRDDLTGDEKKQFDAITAIYAMLQKKRRHVDTTDLMVEINGIINDYVQIEPAEQGVTPSRQFDISGIDFDLLRREFAKAKRKNLVIRDLDLVIQQRIAALLFNNPNRINYYEQYQKIIEAYNSEQDRATIEKTFAELMKLAQSMTQEQQRYVREGFTSDEELSLYDMLFRDDLSKADIKKIKEVAVSLLAKVKEKISQLDHWTDKQETKAVVDTLIRDTLWNELPECYDDLSISHYRQQIYEYVYTRYPDVA